MANNNPKQIGDVREALCGLCNEVSEQNNCTLDKNECDYLLTTLHAIATAVWGAIPGHCDECSVAGKLNRNLKALGLPGEGKGGVDEV